MITLAATSYTVVSTPVLMAVKEVATIQEGVQWANEQAWRWVRELHRGSAKAQNGKSSFVIDGYKEQPVDDGSDIPFAFFKALTDELMITGCNGEEMFIVGVDEASLEAGTHKEDLEDLPNHGDWAIPQPLDREFSSQGVRIFYAPHGVMYDDGEINDEGWYIQQTSLTGLDGRNIQMPGISDGIGPYSTFEEAVSQIANEFGKWVKPSKDDDQLNYSCGVIPTPSS